MSALSIWTVYERVTDVPEHRFVIRRWEITTAGGSRACEAYGSATLEGVRKAMPRGLFRIDRDPTDPPNVVESWI